MRDRLVRAANAPSVVDLIHGTSIAFALIGDTWQVTFTIRENRIEAHGQPDFSLTASDNIWGNLLAHQPKAGVHNFMHLIRTGKIDLKGDSIVFDRHVHLLRAIIDATRPSNKQTTPGRRLNAHGEYHRISTALGISDIYAERAGSGPALLAFATAGSDTSQWHGVMTNSDLTDHYELITVDLPWHGKSSPAWGEAVGSYRLTPQTYTEFIVAVAHALELQRPTLVGVSMGGAAVVHAIATHPEKFRGAVACQAGPSVHSRTSMHHRSPHVNSALFIPEWTYGLMNPASPEEFKQRVWWGYSSGGYGLYAADIESYSSWDFSLVGARLTTKSPHIAVLSGVFDTSVPMEKSRELAQLIPNASFEVMPELGHFPHAENPAVFVQHLESALQRVYNDS